MNQALRDFQSQQGAIFDDKSLIPLSFGNDEVALAASQTGVVLCDRSHWGLIQLTGDDRYRFLHNQTTNAINSLQLNQECETVFVTSTGRTLDLVTVYVLEKALWVLVSPNRGQFLLEWMDRYLFPMDKVELKDISSEYAIFTLICDKSTEILQNSGITLPNQPLQGTYHLTKFADCDTLISSSTGLKRSGLTLIVPQTQALTLWSTLSEQGAIPMGDRLWEHLRIQQGRPQTEQELTEDYNPLEAGLWDAISFDKGCYIGQETIARLNTYKGVKQRLWGIKLNRPVDIKTPITLNGQKAGIVTSYSAIGSQHLALGYLRTKVGGVGLTVQIGDAVGEVVAVPFLSHDYR